MRGILFVLLCLSSKVDAQIMIDGDLGSATGFGVAIGNTIGANNGYSATCGSENSPDAVYTWTAPASGTFKFDTLGSSYDTVLSIHDGDPTLGAMELGCNDDADIGSHSEIEATVFAGLTYYIIIGGFGNMSDGDYTLSITPLVVLPPKFVGGMVTGMLSGNAITLQNNAVDDLTVSDNNAFVFSIPINIGSTYSVTVLNQPDDPIQSCTVLHASGVIADEDITDVMVNCEVGVDLIFRDGFQTQ